MKGQRLAVLLVAFGLIGGAAILLGRVKGWLRLGLPGVRVVAEEMPGAEPLPGGTNRLFVAGTQRVELPVTVPGYRSELRPVDKVVYDWLPKDTTYGGRLYVAPDGFQVLSQVVLMGTDRTSMHQPQACLPLQGWLTESTEHFTLDMDRPRPYRLPITQLTLSWQHSGAQAIQARGLFFYWYVTADELTADARTGMWYQARRLIRTGELQRWAYVSYFALCPPGQEQPCVERVCRLIRATVPEFQLFPPRADAAP